MRRTRQRLLLATFTSIALSTHPFPLGAQDRPADPRAQKSDPEVVAIPHGPHAREILEMRAKMDSLAIPLRRFLIRDSLVYDSVSKAQRKRAPKPDTSIVGPFSVVGDRIDLLRIVPAFEGSWRRMGPMFTGIESDVRGKIFLVTWYWDNRQAIDSAGITRVNRSRAESPEEFGWLTDQTLGAILTRRLPRAVQAWLGSDVTIGSAGDVHQIRQTLAFAGRSWLTSGEAASTNHCAGGVLDDCLTLLALSDSKTEQAPPLLRASFISHIVEHAPPGSVAKWSNDPSATVDAIEHLGGAPIKTLIRRWLRDLDAQSPARPLPMARITLTTLFWAGACGLMAMRSTRWRLG